MDIETILKQNNLENSTRLFDCTNLNSLDYVISILEDNESLKNVIKEINNLKINLLKKEKNCVLKIQGFKFVEPKRVKFNNDYNEVIIDFFNLDLNGKIVKSNGYLRIDNDVVIRNLFDLEDNYKALLLQNGLDYFHLFIFKDTDNIINEEFINKVKLHLTI